MELKTKYNIGDEVWTVQQTHFLEESKCDSCGMYKSMTSKSEVVSFKIQVISIDVFDSGPKVSYSTDDDHSYEDDLFATKEEAEASIESDD